MPVGVSVSPQGAQAFLLGPPATLEGFRPCICIAPTKVAARALASRMARSRHWRRRLFNCLSQCLYYTTGCRICQGGFAKFFNFFSARAGRGLTRPRSPPARAGIPALRATRTRGPPSIRLSFGCLLSLGWLYYSTAYPDCQYLFSNFFNFFRGFPRFTQEPWKSACRAPEPHGQAPAWTGQRTSTGTRLRK